MDPRSSRSRWRKLPPGWRRPGEDPYPLRDAQGPYCVKKMFSWVKERPKDLAFVSSIAFDHCNKQGELPEATSLYEINGLIESLQSGRDPLDLDEEELKHLVNERLPRRYDSYRDVFSKIASDTLPGK